MLKIDKTVTDGVATVTLGGRLDTSTAPGLEKELASFTDGISELVFDIKELEYVSSAGLRVFLITQKKMNAQGKMILRNVCEDVYDVFEITGFTDILTIE